VKTLTVHDLIELLPPEPAMVDAAMRRFDSMAPALCREAGYCRELMTEGFITPLQIKFRGQPAYIIGWRMTTDRGLWIEVAQTLSAGAPTEVLIEAVSMLADRERPRYVRFLTARRGLARLGTTHGYRAEAVLLTKTL
jgi:hypothetical protein